jgi:hypothetical protein
MRYVGKKWPIPFCELCVRTAIVKDTRYGERAMCPGCGRWSWGRKPLADAATHAARKAAHAAFDPLWQQGFMTRGAAYRLLQQALGLTEDECHMAIMDRATAVLVPAAADEIRSRVDPEGTFFAIPDRRAAIAHPMRPTW